jgi:uncharacterized protein
MRLEIDIITAGKNPLDDEIAKIKQFAINTAKATKHHGLDHWKNVERFGLILAKRTGASLPVVRAFAYLHDISRFNDWVGLDHGKRAAKLVRQNSQIISFLTPRERARLLFAIEYHTDVKSSSDETVNTCWDSDRLDLTRIGIIPDPNLVASDDGYYLAANPDKLQTEIDRLTYASYS